MTNHDFFSPLCPSDPGYRIRDRQTDRQADELSWAAVLWNVGRRWQCAWFRAASLQMRTAPGEEGGLSLGWVGLRG